MNIKSQSGWLIRVLTHLSRNLSSTFFYGKESTLERDIHLCISLEGRISFRIRRIEYSQHLVILPESIMNQSLIVIAFVHRTPAEDENEYARTSTSIETLISARMFSHICLASRDAQQFLQKRLFGIPFPREAEEKNTKNGKIDHGSPWTMDAFICLRCERAMDINKVTSLQRWCPKLEVRQWWIIFLREWDEWRTAAGGDKWRKG